MDSDITLINIHKQKINSKLNENISVTEGRAIFSCFYLMLKLNIQAGNYTFTCQIA